MYYSSRNYYHFNHDHDEILMTTMNRDPVSSSLEIISEYPGTETTKINKPILLKTGTGSSEVES